MCRRISRSIVKAVWFFILICTCVEPGLCQSDEDRVTGISKLWSRQVAAFADGSSQTACQDAKADIQKYLLENGTSRAPEISIAYTMLGYRAFESEQWQDAHWAFTSALDLDPLNVRAAQFALINARHLTTGDVLAVLAKRVAIGFGRITQPGVRHLVFGNMAWVSLFAAVLAAFCMILVIAIKQYRLCVHECTTCLPFHVDFRIIGAGLLLLILAVPATRAGLPGFAVLALIIGYAFAEKHHRITLWMAWGLITLLFPLSLIHVYSMTTESNRLFAITRFVSTGGYSEPAITELKSLMKDASDRDTVARIHYMMGLLYKRGGFYTDAQREYEQYRDLKPRDASVYINLGNIEFVNDRYQAAVELYRRAENLDPRNPVIFFNLSKAHLAQFRFDEARNMQNQASRLDPDLTSKLNSLYGSDLIRMVAEAGIPEQWLWEEPKIAWKKAMVSLPHFWRIPYIDIDFKKAVAGWVILTLALIVVHYITKMRSFSRYCIKCGKPMKPDHKSGGTDRICVECHMVFFRKGDTEKQHDKKESKYPVNWDSIFHVLLSVIIPGGGRLYSSYFFSGIIMILAWAFSTAYLLSCPRTFNSYLKIPALDYEPGFLAAGVLLVILYLISIIRGFMEENV
jgi:hypothetical protein